MNRYRPSFALSFLSRLLFLLLLALAGCIRTAQPALFTLVAPTSPYQLVEETQSPFPTFSPTVTELTPGKTSSPPSPTTTPSPSTASPQEQPVTLIPLSGPVARANAEISSLAWYSDTLILLPQFPSRFGSGDGSLFGLKRARLVEYLDGGSMEPLEPFEIPFFAPGLAASIRGYEGFEGIAFAGERAFLTIEARPSGMQGYLVGGEIEPDLTALRLDPLRRTTIQPQTGITNMSDEALLVAGQRILTLYEANGQGVNPSPQAHLFDFFLQPQGEISFPHLEYRLTDVTSLDRNGRFWAINYFFPGDVALWTEEDPLSEQYGTGATHAQSLAVERLVEFGFTEAGMVRTDQAPLQIELDLTGPPRNWEGLARLEERGLLLVTDKFPGTLLAFVPFPNG